MVGTDKSNYKKILPEALHMTCENRYCLCRALQLHKFTCEYNTSNIYVETKLN